MRGAPSFSRGLLRESCELLPVTAGPLPLGLGSFLTGGDLVLGPGTRNWYRVAAVNGKGQGPWSEPTCRPVRCADLPNADAGLASQQLGDAAGTALLDAGAVDDVDGVRGVVGIPDAFHGPRDVCAGDGHGLRLADDERALAGVGFTGLRRQRESAGEET